MTSEQTFRDNSKPLTNHPASLVDAYASAHNPSRVGGYLDGVADVVEYLETRILINTPGNFRPLTKDQMRFELEQLCQLAKKMIQSTPSTISKPDVLQIP